MKELQVTAPIEIEGLVVEEHFILREPTPEEYKEIASKSIDFFAKGRPGLDVFTLSSGGKVSLKPPLRIP